jgi:hypothetical protein
VADTVALPSAQGLDITFDTYQYGNGSSTAADGLMFFLAAANPEDPQPPTTLGAPGGYLAYSGNTGSGGGAGLDDGYLGVGLDVFGNYTNSQSDGTGCSDPSWAGIGEAVPKQVTVRGPGAGTTGYCLLSSTSADGGLRGALDGGSGGARAGSQVPVEVAVNPTGTAQTTNSGLAVAAYSYVIAVTPLGAATQLVSGTLPYDTYLPAADSSWLNATTGIPLQFTMGFAASTGAFDNIHEITNVQASTLTTQPPELGLALTDSEAGVLVRGSSDSYTAIPVLSSSAGAEDAAPALDLTFPAGVTPTSASGSNWSCTTSTPTVTCNFTGSLPVSPGTSIPAISIAGNIAGNASGAQEVAATLWENGAVAAQASDTGTATSAGQSAPALGLTFSDSAGGQLAEGGTVSYTAIGEVSSQGGADTGALTFSADFPSTETINSASGTGWSCAVSAPYVSCNWTGGTVAPGTELGPVTVQVTVGTGASGAATATAALSSPSASPTSVTVGDDAVVASAPTLDVTVADNESGDLTLSSMLHYTANTSVSSSGWAEADAPVVTDNFPAVFSSVSKDVSSTNWSCSQLTTASVITETCAYSGAVPIAAGTALQTLQFDNTVETSGNTGTTADDSVSVQSADAPVASATDYARIGEGPAPNFSVTASAPASATSSYSLTLGAAVLATGGATSFKPTVEASLPSGESFSSGAASGWNCAVSGAGSTLLTCITASASVSAGTALGAIHATVVPGAVGLHTVQVTMSDSLDGAFEVSTSSTTDSLAPVLVLAASPMSAQAAAGGSYSLSLSGATGSSGGEAFNDLSLSVALPTGESFPTAPTAPGWTCAIPGTNDAQLNCTYLVNAGAPLAPGTNLATVTTEVAVSPSASGTLQATALLADTGDGATAAEQQPSVSVGTVPVLTLSATGTPSGASAGTSYVVTITAATGALGGDAYNEPSLSVTLPLGESFPATAPAPTGWTCAVSGPGDITLACTSTASLPLSPGTPLGSVLGTVDIASSTRGPLTTSASLTDAGDNATSALASPAVDVTAAPGLTLTMSGTPTFRAANTSYLVVFSPSLNSTGPAYNDPGLTADLPSGETFASPAPTPSGWTCTLSAGNADLGCTSTHSLSIGAGTALAGVTATVDIAPGASGTLTTDASLTDGPDDATAGTTSQSVQVTASPVLVLTSSGTPTAATVDNSYTLRLGASLSNAGGVAYNDPALSVGLPSGETFASPAPTPSGWTCTLSAGNADLGCTSTHSLPIGAGTGLGTVTASVNIGPGATGLLTTTASLSDPGDGATPATQTPAVDVTSPPAMALSLSGTPAGATAGTDYALNIVPSVAGSAGPAYNDPALVVTLPNGESFTTSATSPSGWACALSAANTVLTCTSTTFTPIAAGSSLADIPMTVAIATSARGALATDASLSDSPDDASAATATATVTATAPPVLALATSGTPASASAPGSYPLTLTPSLRSSGGAAYMGHPTLSVSLPYGETFQSPVPALSGWSCAYSSGNSDLGCTSTASGPTAPGSSLASVTVTVDIGSGASGTLTTTATFSDSADLATPVTQDPAVGISPAAPPSGGPEPPPFPVTSATTTTTSTSTTSTSTTSTSTTSTSTTPTSTTSTSTTSTTLPVGGGTSGPGPLQTPVLPPVLKVFASAPATVTAGGSFTLKISVSLAKKGGPAYHDPAFSVDLPANTSFAVPAPHAADWACALSGGNAVLTCTWAAKVPLPAGRSLGSVSASVEVASNASGHLTATATLEDTPDAARTARASATVSVSGKSTFTQHYGYRLVATDGGVFSFGDAGYDGSCQQKAKPCGAPRKVHVAALSSLPTGNGYWLAATDGSVYSFGRARNLGSCPQDKKVCGKSRPTIVDIDATANGKGYWLTASNGAVFAFGDARNYGSCATSVKTCGKVHPAVVGMAVTPDAKGYWLVEKTGAVLHFGDARKLTACTTSAKACQKLLGKISGVASAAAGQGYWLVASGGRVFAFGAAKFLGDVYTTKDQKALRGTVVGLTAMGNNAGYWEVSSSGVVIAFKGAKFLGDIYTAKVKKLAAPLTGMAST